MTENDTNQPEIAKKNSRRAMWVYFFSYLLQGALTGFISMYISLYFVNVQKISDMNVGLIVAIGYIPYVIKPILGWVMNKVPIKGNHRKPYILIGNAIFSGACLLIATINLQESFALGVLLFFTILLGQAICDVAVDGIVLDRAKTDAAKFAVYVRVASTIGGQIIAITYLIFVGTNIEGGNWAAIFVSLTIISLIFALLSLTYDEIAENQRFENLTPAPIIAPIITPSPKRKKNQRLFVLYCFFSQAPSLAEHIMEPELVGRFGPQSMVDFTYIMGMSQLIGIVIFVFILKYREKIHPMRNNLLLAMGVYAVIFWLTFAFGPLQAILGLMLLNGPVNHIFAFCFLSLFIELTPKNNRAMKYQLYASLWAAVKIGFTALGNPLRSLIGADMVFIVIIILLLPLIPVLISMDLSPEAPTEEISVESD